MLLEQSLDAIPETLSLFRLLVLARVLFFVKILLAGFLDRASVQLRIKSSLLGGF
jgi:hypothetical protein